MDRKNGATQFLRLPTTRRQGCAHRACSRVMGGCSFFLWCSARPQLWGLLPSWCSAQKQQAYSALLSFFFFLSVPVGVLGLQTSSMHRAGHIEEKTTIKSRGLITKFLFECLLLDSILSYLSLLETSAVCLIYLYHDFEYYKTSTVDF